MPPFWAEQTDSEMHIKAGSYQPPAFSSRAAATASPARIPFLNGWPRRRRACRRPAALGETRKGDRDDEGRAVEQGLHEELAAELLNPRDADGQDRDAEHGAPDVDPARLDGRRAEEGADERRQQVVEADIRLPDPELRGEHAASEARDQRRGDEDADNVVAHRNTVQRRRLFVGADRVDMAAERQPLADNPESCSERENVKSRDRNAEDCGRVDRDEARRKRADELTSVGEPQRQRVKDGAGSERRDEGVDLRDLD